MQPYPSYMKQKDVKVQYQNIRVTIWLIIHTIKEEWLSTLLKLHMFAVNMVNIQKQLIFIKLDIFE